MPACQGVGVCVASPVRIHSDAIAAEKGAIQIAIISAAIALIHSQQYQAAFVGLNVFRGGIAHLVTAEKETE